MSFKGKMKGTSQGTTMNGTLTERLKGTLKEPLTGNQARKGLVDSDYGKYVSIHRPRDMSSLMIIILMCGALPPILRGLTLY